MDFKPAPGKIALRFVDDGGEYVKLKDSSESHPPSDDAVMATVVAAGAEVKGLKKGDTVLVHSYAKDGTRVDDTTVVTDSWCWIGTIVD